MPGYEDVWRDATPHVLAALLRRYGDLETAQDAVQEALLAAARQWPVDGMPDRPAGLAGAGRVAAPGRRLAVRHRADRSRGGDLAGRAGAARPASTATTRWPCCCCAAIRR